MLTAAGTTTSTHTVLLANNQVGVEFEVSISDQKLSYCDLEQVMGIYNATYGGAYFMK